MRRKSMTIDSLPCPLLYYNVFLLSEGAKVLVFMSYVKACDNYIFGCVLHLI